MQIFPNLSNACIPAEWGKQPNAIERHLDSIVTNVRRPLSKCTPNTVTLEKIREHVDVFVTSRVRENSKTFVYDNKKARQRRRRRRATWEMGPRTGKGGCRLFFMSPAAFQAAVVTLLECFQRGP